MINELETTAEKINNNIILGEESVPMVVVDSVVPKPILIMDHVHDRGVAAVALAHMAFRHSGFSVMPASNVDMMKLAKRDTEPLEFKLTNHHLYKIPVKASTFRRSEPKVSRNAPCPCGSGKKSKRCCGQY